MRARRENLISRKQPWWVSAPVLAAAWWAAIVYGSLLPFDFALQDAPAFGAWLTGPRWIVGSSSASALGIAEWFSDLAVNLLLYLPLGVLLRFAARRVDRKPACQALTAALLVMATSWLLECAQALSPSRVASINDFLANTAGGLLGITFAPPLWSATRAIIFWIYRKAAHSLLTVSGWLIRHRRATAMIVLMTIMAMTLGLAWSPPPAHTSVPFAHHFAQPYDVAALELGGSLIVYGMIGALLSLLLARNRTRRIIGLVALLVAGLAIIARGGDLNLTEPILAACAVLILFVLWFLADHAVRRSCRRRQQVPVAHDRRRRTHNYGFVLLE